MRFWRWKVGPHLRWGIARPSGGSRFRSAWSVLRLLLSLHASDRRRTLHQTNVERTPWAAVNRSDGRIRPSTHPRFKACAVTQNARHLMKRLVLMAFAALPAGAIA